MAPTATFVIVAGAAVALGAQARMPGAVREFMAMNIVDESPGATANVSVGDLDGDGDLDLVLAKGRHWESVDRVLINDGRGTFMARNLGTAQDSSYPRSWLTSTATATSTSW